MANVNPIPMLKIEKQKLEAELKSLERLDVNALKNDPAAKNAYNLHMKIPKTYSNPERAREIQKRIMEINNQIFEISRNMSKANSKSKNLYGDVMFEEAKKAAQKRLLGMGKIKRTIYKINGQQKKFEELWKTSYENKGDANLISELNGLFGGKSR